jgi:hypothetical protein
MAGSPCGNQHNIINVTDTRVSPHWKMQPSVMKLHCWSEVKSRCSRHTRYWLTLSNPIFLPTAYSPALIYCGRERGWSITCWLKSVLHEEKCRTGSYSGAGEQTPKKVWDRLLQRSGQTNAKKKCRTSPDIGAEWENHNVGWGPT